MTSILQSSNAPIPIKTRFLFASLINPTPAVPLLLVVHCTNSGLLAVGSILQEIVSHSLPSLFARVQCRSLRLCLSGLSGFSITLLFMDGFASVAFGGLDHSSQPIRTICSRRILRRTRDGFSSPWLCDSD